MDSYFIPKIEDLKENYQFEYQEYDEELDIFKDNWIKTNFDSRGGLGHDLTHQFQSGNVRCEFLTKEQIEAEGWKLLGILKENTIIAYLKKETIIYTINYEKSILTITKLLRKENMNFLDDQLYKGTCPSINEFKTICKLLNIK